MKPSKFIGHLDSKHLKQPTKRLEFLRYHAASLKGQRLISTEGFTNNTGVTFDIAKHETLTRLEKRL